MKSYSEDILFQKETPIFATAKAPITLIKKGVLDERETEMLLSDGVCLRSAINYCGLVKSLLPFVRTKDG